MTMRFAHVGSLGTYAILAHMGEIALFQAPLVLADCEYTNFCQEFSQHHFAIMDSGALEIAIGTEKSKVSHRELLHMAMDLKVAEVIAPDSPGDFKGSIRLTMSFIRIWKKIPENYHKPRLMLVPHAKTINKWLELAELFAHEVPCCTIGIPRVFASSCGNGNAQIRSVLSDILVRRIPTISIHLLGAGMNFIEEIPFILTSSTIRSVDSTFVHRYCVTRLDPTKEYVPPQNLHNKNCPKHFSSSARSLIEHIRGKRNT